MAASGCSVEHCPTTALKVGYGVTQVGKIPEMVMRGINVSIGIDGNNLPPTTPTCTGPPTL